MLYRFKTCLLAFVCWQGGTIAFGQGTATLPVKYSKAVWASYNLQVLLPNQMQILADYQHRRTGDFERAYQIGYRAGIGYVFSPAFSSTAGVALFQNYLVEPNRVDPDYRLWQQVTLKQTIFKLKLENRYRLEQRWVQSTPQNPFNDAPKIYSNRIRYRAMLQYPLLTISSDDEKRKPLLNAVVNNELFIQFGENVSGRYFDQNRFNIGLIGILSPATSVQLGYMNHYSALRTSGAFQSTGALQFSISNTIRAAEPEETKPQP